MDPTPVLVAHADLAREILHRAALPDVRSTKQGTLTIQAAHRNKKDPPADVLRLLVLSPGVNPAAAAAATADWFLTRHPSVPQRHPRHRQTYFVRLLEHLKWT